MHSSRVSQDIGEFGIKNKQNSTVSSPLPQFGYLYLGSPIWPLKRSCPYQQRRAQRERLQRKGWLILCCFSSSQNDVGGGGWAALPERKACPTWVLAWALTIHCLKRKMRTPKKGLGFPRTDYEKGTAQGKGVGVQLESRSAVFNKAKTDLTSLLALATYLKAKWRSWMELRYRSLFPAEEVPKGGAYPCVHLQPSGS